MSLTVAVSGEADSACRLKEAGKLRTTGYQQ